jgi:hypothetical protein
MADPGALTASSIAIGQTVFAYSYFLPPLREVRRADPNDPDVRGDVILGQVAAMAVSLSIGGLVTWMTGSTIPVLTTIAVAVVIAIIYHYALQGGSTHAV